MEKTLGGDRLGAGKKMKVHLHNYERSTHDIGYVWRSTMSSGTLVPFMDEVALPGTTFDINLGCEVLTHPTIGPLFGSYKVQLDVFLIPIRLYNSELHNNTLGIGRNMSTIKLPQIEFTIAEAPADPPDLDNLQVNPSCLLAYLGIRGYGYNPDPTPATRQFNAVSILAYWEIYKNYYANKQEEIGAVIHRPEVPAPWNDPVVVTFPLSNLDDMRREILKADGTTTFIINDTPATPITPYVWLAAEDTEGAFALSTQEGLAIKTYQSDLFNNWLKTENIEAISTATAIDTSGGSFTIDQFVISRKVWNMLNRINVSGGSYNDWLDAVYVHEKFTTPESPMYMGGLIKELIFQEVVSNTETTDQPLGTLAGRGKLADKHKGGTVVIHVDEPSMVMGIVSLTPRVDYSQGNKWHVQLKTMDDFHKPALDEIGFQDLITEQMAWWSTIWNGATWSLTSAGKQPAWINYMTNVNKTYGNFAIEDNEMFMTLNRRYEADVNQIEDLTTYIDPAKYNFIFAETALDAQNFWVQIGVDITARRKMSGKLMPNL